MESALNGKCSGIYTTSSKLFPKISLIQTPLDPSTFWWVTSLLCYCVVLVWLCISATCTPGSSKQELYTSEQPTVVKKSCKALICMYICQDHVAHRRNSAYTIIVHYNISATVSRLYSTRPQLYCGGCVGFWDTVDLCGFTSSEMVLKSYSFLLPMPSATVCIFTTSQWMWLIVRLCLPYTPVFSFWSVTVLLAASLSTRTCTVCPYMVVVC